MAKRGPKLKIDGIDDWAEFDRLCEMHCTLEELAGWFRCSPDTVESSVKREKGMKFSDYSTQKRGAGKASLRRRQHQVAMEGDKTMLIWLGKQWLGQDDRQTIAHTGEGGGPVAVKLVVEFVEAKE